MRHFNHNRSFYIPAGSLKIADRQSDAIAYVAKRMHARTGKEVTHVVAFCGKRQKPDMNAIYSTDAGVQRAISEYFANRKSSLDYTNTRRAERNADATLQVGQILTGSWGYDQTNVEAWQVVEIVGRVTVKLRRVAIKAVAATSFDSERVVPCPDAFIDDEILTKRVAGGDRIRFDCFSLSPWNCRLLHSSWGH